MCAICYCLFCGKPGDLPSPVVVSYALIRLRAMVMFELCVLVLTDQQTDGWANSVLVCLLTSCKTEVRDIKLSASCQSSYWKKNLWSCWIAKLCHIGWQYFKHMPKFFFEKKCDYMYQPTPTLRCIVHTYFCTFVSLCLPLWYGPHVCTKHLYKTIAQLIPSKVLRSI